MCKFLEKKDKGGDKPPAIKILRVNPILEGEGGQKDHESQDQYQTLKLELEIQEYAHQEPQMMLRCKVAKRKTKGKVRSPRYLVNRIEVHSAVILMDVLKADMGMA